MLLALMTTTHRNSLKRGNQGLGFIYHYWVLICAFLVGINDFFFYTIIFILDVRGRPTKESLVRSTVSVNLLENKSEVQFRLREEVVMPQTDQMKKEQSQKERKNMATGDDPVETDRRPAYEAFLEEDLIGSDNDEVCLPSGRGNMWLPRPHHVFWPS